MSVNTEYCDPFAGDKRDIWMKLEHCGRYLYACELLSENRCSSVIDLACANGYGSHMLAHAVPHVIAADRNPVYMNSDYLNNSRIETFCFDFDAAHYPDTLAAADAVVCFETIEHLRRPFAFLKRMTDYIHPGGWLLLSFPNAEYERLNPDGSNRDPFHLHILSLDEVLSELQKDGLQVMDVRGQPICNEICSRQHELKLLGKIRQDAVDQAFSYDRASVSALSQVMAYPLTERVELSYSFLITARKPEPCASGLGPGM